MSALSGSIQYRVIVLPYRVIDVEFHDGGDYDVIFCDFCIPKKGIFLLHSKSG